MSKDKGFFQCYNSIFRDGKLTAHEKVVFCVLLSLSKGGTEDIFVSYETVAKFAGIGRTKAYTCIRQLMKKKFIKYAEKQKRNSKSYSIVNKWTVHQTNMTSSRDEQQKFTRRTGEVHEMNSTNSTSLNITTTNKKPKKKNPATEVCEEIISYLNQKCNREFDVSNKNHHSYIRRRWKEYPSAESFKHVIDVYSVKWDTDKMRGFLQPSTLFNEKFCERVKDKLPPVVDVYATPSAEILAKKEEFKKKHMQR